MLLGLQGGQMVVVGARPAMGKTALTLSMAANVAQQTQKPVLFFSLEMSRMEVVDRLVSGYARIPLRNVRSADMSADEWKRYDAVHSAIASVPLFVVDEPGVDLARIRMEVRKLRQMEGNLGLVVIDYLQLMTPGGMGGGRKSREQEVSEMSRGIKLTAKEFEVPILSLSQLSRNLEQRADKRPILADLRESGCLTADTKILRADTNKEITIGELFEQGATNIPVWSVDEHYKLVKSNMTKVFFSGNKDTYKLCLRSGREVKASGNHPFLTVEGWKSLDELIVTDHVAVPDSFPEMPAWPSEIEDVIPEEIWKYISRTAIPQQGMTAQTFRDALSREYNTATMIMGHDISRDRMETIAKILTLDNKIHDLLTGEVLWDEVIAIEPLGVEPVYDATVETTHNFIANGIVAHNSIEQDADIVLFLYRDEVYHPDTPDIGTAEIIVAKHRQGSSGTCRVGFISSYALFANMNSPSVLTSRVSEDYLPSLAGDPEKKSYDSDQFHESSAGFNEF
jgi:replicative DNA helicase